ncbi:MAG: CsgG/HfaB family protein [Myxococcota bacterium]
MLLFLGICSAATLAVLPFDNHTGDAANDALGVGVADMLVTDLGEVASLELIERSRMRDVLAEMELSRSDWVDPTRAAKAGRGLGAEWMLVGSVIALEPKLRIDARLVEVESGRVLHSVSAEGPRDTFFEVEKELAFGVTEKLGIAISAREAGRVGRVATESFAAFRDWSAGLDALDRGAVEDARKRFEAALAHDSGFGAAGDALSGLKASLASSAAVRQESIDADMSDVLARIARYRDAGRRGARDPAATAELREVIGAATARYYQLPFSDQRELCGALVELGLPETFVMGEGPHERSVTEWAMGCTAMASASLEDRASLLAWGQEYVDRYPTGPYYPSVRGMLDQLVAIIDKEESARASGVIEAALLKRTGEMMEDRCGDEPDRRRSPAQCREWLVWMRDHERLEVSDLRRIRSRACADASLLGEVREALVSMGAPASEVAGIDSDLATLEKHVARKAEWSEPIEQVLAGQRRTVSYSVIDPWMRVCDFDEARRQLLRVQHAMDARNVQTAEWKLARAIGDDVAIEALGAIARTQERPFKLEHEVRSALDEIRTGRFEVDQARARMLEQYASDLDSAGLERMAAETLETLYTEFPDYWYRKPENILSRLAYAWYSAYDADALARSEHWYRVLIERFPNSSEADAARARLSTFPR